MDVNDLEKRLGMRANQGIKAFNYLKDHIPHFGGAFQKDKKLSNDEVNIFRVYVYYQRVYSNDKYALVEAIEYSIYISNGIELPKKFQISGLLS